MRIEAHGRCWVVSGDYKRDPDPTCPPFEVVPCDGFLTEATFALRDLDGHTAEEVCDVLGISAGNQRVLLHRGRAVVNIYYISHRKPGSFGGRSPGPRKAV